MEAVPDAEERGDIPEAGFFRYGQPIPIGRAISSGRCASEPTVISSLPTRGSADQRQVRAAFSPIG